MTAGPACARRGRVSVLFEWRLRHPIKPATGGPATPCAAHGHSLRSSSDKETPPMPEPVLVTEPTHHLFSLRPRLSPAPGLRNRQSRRPSPATIRTLEKGYKLTLWSPRPRTPACRRQRSAPARRADPVPFCVLKASAIRSFEAPGSLRRHRAGKSQASTNGCPVRRSRGAAPGVPRRSRRPAHRGGQAPSSTPSTSIAAPLFGAAPTPPPEPPHAHATPGTSSRPRSFKTGSLCMPELGSRDRSGNGHCPAAPPQVPGVGHYPHRPFSPRF